MTGSLLVQDLVEAHAASGGMDLGTVAYLALAASRFNGGVYADSHAAARCGRAESSVPANIVCRRILNLDVIDGQTVIAVRTAHKVETNLRIAGHVTADIRAK